jgi:hypothetical protein
MSESAFQFGAFQFGGFQIYTPVSLFEERFIPAQKKRTDNDDLMWMLNLHLSNCHYDVDVEVEK